VKKSLIAFCAAVMLGASSGVGVAAAQPFPSLPTIDYMHDPLVQLMLQGEADAVSQYLGISIDQLQSELTGHSVADVARQHGKSVAEITRVMVQTANQQLDADVSAGQLSADTANQYRSEIALFAPLMVNSADASAFALHVANAEA
jgi:Trp operon repressor